MTYETIIFDLDDTLYPRGNGLMREVGRRIEMWMRGRLGLSGGEARRMRDCYFRRYGTTLGGLMAHHDVDVHDYLMFVHDIPLQRYIGPNPVLDHMLASIPLQKVVYTNASSEHAWRVLQALGVAERFEHVIGIEEVGMRNKVEQVAYEQVLVRLNTWGPACIMVEDSPYNLRPAKALGMTTVLVGAAIDWSVDFLVGDVLEVGGLVNGLLAQGEQGSQPPGSS